MLHPVRIKSAKPISPKQWVIQIPSGDVSINNIEEFVDLFFPSVPPSVSLSTSPSNYLREYWDYVNNPEIRCNISLWSNPTKNITDIIYYKNWTELYHWDWNDTSYTDNATISSNTTYKVKIIDELNREASSTISYNFVYPFFWGVAYEWQITDWINEEDISNILTKNISYKWNKSVVSSPQNQRFVFLYPDSYWNLSSILDQNWFETIWDYDISTITITNMLDWTDQTYKFYKLKNDTTQTNFTNTYYF